MIYQFKLLVSEYLIKLALKIMPDGPEKLAFAEQVLGYLGKIK